MPWVLALGLHTLALNNEPAQSDLHATCAAARVAHTPCADADPDPDHIRWIRLQVRAHQGTQHVAHGGTSSQAGAAEDARTGKTKEGEGR
jgi:hypothetical protein